MKCDQSSKFQSWRTCLSQSLLLQSAPNIYPKDFWRANSKGRPNQPTNSIQFSNSHIVHIVTPKSSKTCTKLRPVQRVPPAIRSQEPGGRQLGGVEAAISKGHSILQTATLRATRISGNQCIECIEMLCNYSTRIHQANSSNSAPLGVTNPPLQVHGSQSCPQVPFQRLVVGS